MADGMLGSVARKLRMLGFDVKYRREEEDGVLMENCSREGRVLLTSDKRLHEAASRRGIRCVLVKGGKDEDMLLEILTGIGVGSVSGDSPRCTICNGELKLARKDEVRGRVPDGVLKRNDEFYMCKSCGKVYWKGSHWKRMDGLIESLNIRLKETYRVSSTRT